MTYNLIKTKQKPLFSFVAKVWFLFYLLCFSILFVLYFFILTKTLLMDIELEQKTKEDISFKKPFILSVGRLDKGKNHSLLIKAFSRLDTDLKLLILGEGPLKDELQRLIKSLNLEQRVFLLGFDKNPYKYMSKCEFFAFASSFEGFSNVLIECLASSCAVLCTDHKSGARELFKDDEFGLLVKVDDEDSMFYGLKKMIEDKELRKLYKQRAKFRAKDFDKTKIAKEALAFLKD